MKNQLFIGAIAITGLFTACNNAPAGEKVEATDAQSPSRVYLQLATMRLQAKK